MLRSLWHDRLGGQGQVQSELAVVLVKPCLSLRIRVASELAWLEIPERPAAVAHPVETDLLAARRRGLTGVLVKIGKCLLHAHRRRRHPGHVLDSFADLAALLEQLS